MSKRAKTLAEAAAIGRAMAGKDAAVFLAHGWDMDDEWPLSNDVAGKLVAEGADRGRLIAAIRDAGRARWRELRGRRVSLALVLPQQ